MPDHVHLFCSPATYPLMPLGRWVAFWKSSMTRHWPSADEKPIFQRDFWDTQLRSADHYSAKWEYVRHNPVRAGLVRSVGELPYQGELEMLRE